MRLHRATVLGRLRSDPGPLVLIGLAVALTTALVSAVPPVTAHTADRALADLVRHAGSSALVVATFPGEEEDFGPRPRDPRAAAQFRVRVTGAQRALPKGVAAAVRPGTAAVVSPPLHLLGAGPGRYLSLAYLTSATGGPGVRYTAGGPPRPTVGGSRADVRVPAGAAPWPVQVALSRPAAAALHLAPGDRLDAEDDQGRAIAVRVSGIFVARDPGADAWQTTPELLSPDRGVSEGIQRTSAAALVSAGALPDLRLAVPSDDLTEKITLNPRPERLRLARSAALVRAIGSLKASPGAARGEVSWDTSLDRVVTQGRAQVAAARGQADVLLLGLVACAFLLLWQAADLLVRRRAGSVVLARERGGTLPGIALELFVEAALFALTGALLGLLVTTVSVGRPQWGWWVPVPILAPLAAGVTGAVLAARSTDPRKEPANRRARLVATRAGQLRRALFLATVVAVAVLSLAALRQRGVVDGGDPTAASAPTWWALAGALLVVAVLPRAAGLLLVLTRRRTGGVGFFAAARIQQTGTRALPLVVVMVTVAQLTFALSLASTEQQGQADGALLSVGGDVRVTPAPGSSAAALAGRLADAPGVRSAVAARVEDGVQARSRDRAVSVRLVVVDAAAYEHLLAVSALPDAPQLSRLDRSGSGRVPALLVGGPSGLRDGLTLRISSDLSVPLRVVGPAPRVQGSTDPVVVVDAGPYARAGGVAQPTTAWAVGPGSAAAVRAAGRVGAVRLYADALAMRRSAPLAQGLVRLALASVVLLLLFAVLSVAMAAAGEAVARGASLGRLRALGLRDRQLWGVLAGELVTPVLVGALVGLGLGLSAARAMFGRLSVERITAQVEPPDASIPGWVLLGLAVLLAAALVLAHVEWTRLRRIRLGQLLRR